MKSCLESILASIDIILVPVGVFVATTLHISCVVYTHSHQKNPAMCLESRNTEIARFHEEHWVCSTNAVYMLALTFTL